MMHDLLTLPDRANADWLARALCNERMGFAPILMTSNTPNRQDWTNPARGQIVRLWRHHVTIQTASGPAEYYDILTAFCQRAPRVKLRIAARGETRNQLVQLSLHRFLD